MPLSRLQPIGLTLHRVIIPDEVALDVLGLNIRNTSGAVVMTNYSGCRVAVAHWNGSVPTPQDAPIAVARQIVGGDIVLMDGEGYEYLNAAVA